MTGLFIPLLICCICLVYLIVPLSPWRRQNSFFWKLAILITVSIGFLPTALVLVDEFTASGLSALSSPTGLLNTLFVCLGSGVLFLPLSLANLINRFLRPQR